MALIGTELVKVLPITATGAPSGVDEYVTTLAIASLGGGGGGGTPGGSTGQVQGNNAGSFAGIPNSNVNFTTGATQLQPTVVQFTTTAKTLALTDANTMQSCSNATTQTITIPTNASVAFPINTYIQLEQNGIGSVTITGATGVTLNGVSAGSVVIGTQFSSFYIRQDSANVWYAEGGGNGSVNATTLTVTGAIKSNITQSTLVGTTTGTVVYSQPFQGTSFKKFVAHMTNYSNATVTSQTITFPTAFTNAPVLAYNSTGMTITATTTTVTIVTANSATVFAGAFSFEDY